MNATNRAMRPVELPRTTPQRVELCAHCERVLSIERVDSAGRCRNCGSDQRTTSTRLVEIPFAPVPPAYITK